MSQGVFITTCAQQQKKKEAFKADECGSRPCLPSARRIMHLLCHTCLFSVQGDHHVFVTVGEDGDDPFRGFPPKIPETTPPSATSAKPDPELLIGSPFKYHEDGYGCSTGKICQAECFKESNI